MCGVLCALCELLPVFAKKPRLPLLGLREKKERHAKATETHGWHWPFHASPSPSDEERPPTAGGYCTFSDFDDGHPAVHQLNLDLGRPFEVSVSPSATKAPSEKVATPGYELPQDWEDEYHDHSDLPLRSEGIVRVIQHNASAKLFVVKTVRVRKDSNNVYELPGEVQALACHLQKHHNIVDFHGYELRLTTRHKTAVCDMLLEYCAGGDLHNFCAHWRRKHTYVPSIFILHFIASMSDALAFLHLGRSPLIEDAVTGTRSYDQDPRPYPILHQDIKPENVFLRWSPDNKHALPDIVLGDFGYACPAHESAGLYGTPGYFPPEAKDVWALEKKRPALFDLKIKTQIMSEASDVYTFGATLYALMTSRQFDNRDFDHVPSTLERDVVRSSVGDMPSMLLMLRECLARRPDERCRTEELWASAPAMKEAVALLYETGQRMPDDAYGAGSSPASLVFEEDVGYMGDDVSNVSGIADDVTNLSGFLDEFCWCANHRTLSLRRPGSRCVDGGAREGLPTTAGAQSPRDGEQGMVVCSKGAGALAREYQADIQRSLSEDSEIF